MARILIVDDERNTVGLLALAVAQLGHEPIEAYSGPQAIQLIPDCNPDLVILDYMMPGMNGIETLDRIRKLEGGERVPIVILSARQDFKLKDRVISAGPTDHQKKPIRLSELSFLISRHLQESSVETAADKEG
jgi:CheY-like chemotaxis protein